MPAEIHASRVRMNRFQKLAVAALVSLLMLMAVGAVVRVTGAGMGCPDWPTCWGCLIPPTKVEDVDFSKLPIERFQKKAARMGRDPATITEQSLRAEFNPRHVWTEYINRLCSMPVGFFSLATFIAGFAWRKRRPSVFWLAFGSFVVVLVNAWMGARVVYSGLQPGVITTHLALAMLLLGMLAWCAWRGTERPFRIAARSGQGKLTIAVAVLLVTILTEGIMGALVRELTDELSKSHIGAARTTWIDELENSGVYLLHRSFSWLVLGATLGSWFVAQRFCKKTGMLERGVLGIVLAQMLLGIVMAQIHIYAWVQVLHVSLAAVLLALVWLWLFAAIPVKKTGKP